MLFFFFFNDTATTEIYTLSLHDALPILADIVVPIPDSGTAAALGYAQETGLRSEEHTSELQSRVDLVCRLLLEKKKKGSPVWLLLSFDGLQCRGRHESGLARGPGA